MALHVRHIKKFLLIAISLSLLAISLFAVRTYHTTISVNPQPPDSLPSLEDRVRNHKIDIVGLLELTNQNRERPLLLDVRLSSSAQAKCEDMAAKNYFAHISPNGNTPWVFIRQNAYFLHKDLAENLAEGFTTNKEVVDGWMGSPPHKASIVNPEYTSVGFGICYSASFAGNEGLPTIIVVQHFSN